MQIMHLNPGFVTVWQFFVLTTAPVTAVHRAEGEMVAEKLYSLSQLDQSAWPANNATALSSLLQSLQMQDTPDVQK